MPQSMGAGRPVPTTGMKIPGLIYADDLVLLTETGDRLRDLLNSLANWSSNLGYEPEPTKMWCRTVQGQWAPSPYRSETEEPLSAAYESICHHGTGDLLKGHRLPP